MFLKVPHTIFLGSFQLTSNINHIVEDTQIIYSLLYLYQNETFNLEWRQHLLEAVQQEYYKRCIRTMTQITKFNSHKGLYIV